MYQLLVFLSKDSKRRLHIATKHFTASRKAPQRVEQLQNMDLSNAKIPLSKRHNEERQIRSRQNDKFRNQTEQAEFANC